MTPIFFQKADLLCERWDALISQSAPYYNTSMATIDVSHWLSRATFDVIGLAGFDYQFHSLDDESEEVYLAYRKMFDAADRGPSFKALLQLYFPWVQKLCVSRSPCPLILFKPILT
jgi:hypothetical protein